MEAALCGIALYRQLARDGLFADCFKRRSTFIVASSKAECDVLEAHSNALATAGVPTATLAPRVARDRFPALSPDALMIVEVYDEGHAIGYRIVHRFLTSAGVVVHRGNAVESLLLAADASRVKGVVTAKGAVRADAVVVAAGSGSAQLLGIEHALIPRKGQLLITERAPALNAAMPGAIMSGRYLLSKGSQNTHQAKLPKGLGLVIDPLETGQFLIGGTREDHGDRRDNDIDAVTRILRDAVALVPGLANVRLLRSFAGTRTAVIDGMPLVGRLPHLENAYVATGFEGDGICLGPITGRAISQMVCGETPEMSLAAFDPARLVKSGVVA
ncbi:Hydrogen cyanide synthase subunit HcnC [Ensifer sp. M14]|nr:Hydrogen cyanide synthase subunit HcnC [Ensifer sp. M14]